MNCQRVKSAFSILSVAIGVFKLFPFCIQYILSWISLSQYTYCLNDGQDDVGLMFRKACMPEDVFVPSSGFNFTIKNDTDCVPPVLHGRIFSACKHYSLIDVNQKFRLQENNTLPLAGGILGGWDHVALFQSFIVGLFGLLFLIALQHPCPKRYLSCYHLNRKKNPITRYDRCQSFLTSLALKIAVRTFLKLFAISFLTIFSWYAIKSFKQHKSPNLTYLEPLCDKFLYCHSMSDLLSIFSFFSLVVLCPCYMLFLPFVNVAARGIRNIGLDNHGSLRVGELDSYGSDLSDGDRVKIFDYASSCCACCCDNSDDNLDDLNEGFYPLIGAFACCLVFLTSAVAFTLMTFFILQAKNSGQ